MKYSQTSRVEGIFTIYTIYLSIYLSIYLPTFYIYIYIYIYVRMAHNLMQLNGLGNFNM
jgi:hypothetical protein